MVRRVRLLSLALSSLCLLGACTVQQGELTLAILQALQPRVHVRPASSFGVTPVRSGCTYYTYTINGQMYMCSMCCFSTHCSTLCS